MGGEICFPDISDFTGGGCPSWSFGPGGLLVRGGDFTAALMVEVVFDGLVIIGGVFTRVSFGGSLVFDSGLVSVAAVGSLLPTREVLEPPR